ncbi:MAG: hypothetical protein MUO23_14455 [Anaerolineales bacterium]|nr:hypothetical protein [Anaerolineales bacterium]
MQPPHSHLSAGVLALMLAALGCSWLPDTGTSSLATAVAATVEHSPKDAAATVLPALPGTGRVSGRICYPSESIPAMTGYFRETTTAEVIPMAIGAGRGSYEITLPAGEYHAYAWTTQPQIRIGGSYSQAVVCGLDSSCTDHSLRPFRVAAGSHTNGIDLCDWYGGPGSVPPAPGDLPPTSPAGSTTLPGGISLNCDGSQQRMRLEDAGPAGRTVAVDAWLADAWANVWSVSGGNPMIQQIELEAGPYPFGDCRSLIVVPIRYSGSGADLRLEIYAWDGAGVRQVYSHQGTKGAWAKLGDVIQFREAKFLYGEPNCCPCAVQTTEHTWDGSTFVESRVIVEPTYSGTPPDECRP